MILNKHKTNNKNKHKAEEKEVLNLIKKMKKYKIKKNKLIMVGKLGEFLYGEIFP